MNIQQKEALKLTVVLAALLFWRKPTVVWCQLACYAATRVSRRHWSSSVAALTRRQPPRHRLQAFVRMRRMSTEDTSDLEPTGRRR